MKAKLLIIDDDTRLREAVVRYLRKAGYEVYSAEDGLSGLQQLYQPQPDLVLLDVMMPNMDGWETCRRIREVSQVPVIMLTARGQESDTVMGLRLGADDYVTKPFSLRELEARVEAVLRRSRQTIERADEEILYADDRLVIDRARWVVTIHGKPVDLTVTERKLLFLLAEHAGRVLTPAQILENVWGPEYVDEIDYVKLYIWRLRQKIEEDPSNPQYLLTERGLGYRFAPRPSD